MPSIGIESNGRIEKTAVYYNGERVRGLKEIFLNLDENGTFDTIIQYEGSDKKIYTKQIFSEYLNNLKTDEPAFTEEEAIDLQLIDIESDGDIDTCMVYLNDEPLEGIVSLYIHIRGTATSNGIRSIFKSKENIPDHPEFKAEVTFRNEDDSIETEEIF